jgi:hypothetical protein
MKKIVMERLYSFLENNIAVGVFAIMVAAGGIGAAYAKYEALMSVANR